MKKNIILLLCIAQTVAGVSTLSELQKTAQNLSEFPKNGSTNWRNPNYDELYASLAPGLFTRVIGRQTSIIQTLSQLLVSVTGHRHQKTGSKNHVVKLVAPADSQLIICGEISGGFHSLVRILNYLKQENYLDDSLTLTQPNSYLIFNGNSISRGPYNSETLVTILLLMKQNPNTVFYLKGKQELHNYWANLNVRQELKLRAAPLFKAGIPLKKELTDFLNTLPQGLYVTTSQDSQNYIRISPSGRSDLIIDESIIAQNMPEGTAVVSLQRKKQTAKSDELPNVLSIIKSEKWIKKHRAKEGLAQIDQDQGATAWGLISTPIEAHQKLLGFANDAFAILTVGNPLAASNIALYNRKSGAEDSFKKASSFNIKTGISTNEKDKNGTTGHVTIGSSMALVQGVPIMGQRTKRGMSVRLNDENKKGGISKNLLRSVVYNDNYTPHLTRNNIDMLLSRDNAELILLPVGSPTLASYLDYVRDKKAVVLFPITGGPQFRDPDLKGIVHFRGTYADEVRALVDYMVTEGAAKRFAFFYQDDAYGKEPLKAAHQELKQNGITSWTDVPYQRNSVDYKEQARKIKEAQPDAIGFFSTGQATRELIRQIGIDFLTNKQLFGISFLGEASFRRFLKKHGLKVLFGAVVPNPKTSNLEIVKEYRAAMDANNYPYDIFSLEAYIATSILMDVMQQITPPITKEKILEKLEQLKEYDFKGLKLTFDPERRDLARYIWLESGGDKEWVQKKIVKTTSVKKENNARSINTSRSEQLPSRPTGPSSQ
jgi:branched-chain amino acid transport system substrate-binding protein